MVVSESIPSSLYKYQYFLLILWAVDDIGCVEIVNKMRSRKRDIEATVRSIDDSRTEQTDIPSVATQAAKGCKHPRLTQIAIEDPFQTLRRHTCVLSLSRGLRAFSIRSFQTTLSLDGSPRFPRQFQDAPAEQRKYYGQRHD